MMNPTLRFLAGCLAATLMASTVRAAITLKGDGVTLGAQGAASYHFKYPVILDGARKPSGKVIDATLSGSNAHLKYDNGAEADVAVAGNKVSFNFTNPGANFSTFKFESNLGFELTGVHWKVDGGEAQPVPDVKPPKPHLLQGQAKSFEFQYLTGKTLGLAASSPVFMEFKDCREWGWKNFVLTYIVPHKTGFSLTISGGEAAPAAGGEPAVKKTMVDAFGQYALKDWPGKVKSEEELKADLEEDKAYYGGLNPPAFDSFGGLPGSKEKFGFKQTGFFHVEQKGGRWYLVDPDGNWYFHLSVCSFATYPNNVDPKGRENLYEWLPPYEGQFQTAFGQNGGGTKDGKVNFYIVNRIRKYGVPFDVKFFTTEMIQRVRKFGFNSAGVFGSGDAEARTAAGFPWASELPLRNWQGVKHLPGLREIWDPFDEKIRASVDKNLSGLAKRAGDPLLVGWFLVNEPLYEDIPRVVPTYKEDKACKRRLVQMLEEKYKGIETFNRAWGTSLPSFEEASKQGLPVKTKEASADMKAYKTLFLEEYFKFVSETARKYDPNHMLMGCRLQSGTINDEDLCRIGAKYSDVWSYNYYTYGLDEGFLGKIQQWTGGKPMILSEFHWNSSADSGVLGGAKDVASQQERGVAYRHYVEQAAALPYIVGVEWYTLIDGAVSGFNANCGLFNVVDRPWKPMIAEMVKTNYDIYKVAAGERPKFVYEDPRFSGKGQAKGSIIAERTAKPLAIDGQGGDWPGVPAERIGSNRLVQGKNGEGLAAAVKVCWDNEFLYVIADVEDATPMKNELTPKESWNGDAVELFLGTEEMEKGGQPLFTDRHVLMPATSSSAVYYHNAPEQYGGKSAVSARPDGSGYIFEAAIPWKALAFKAEPNREILFDIGIDESADGKRRDRQLMWSGTAKNSGDRSHWGRLRLVGQ